MKNKTALIRSAVIIGIIVLSLAAGLIGQKVFDYADLKNYPREYSELVEKYASEYGVPEYVVFGVIKYESSFVSNKEGEDGGIGLMGLRQNEFDMMLKLEGEGLSSDALYGPETNIKYGTCHLAYLYNKFGKWEAVFAAKAAGTEAVDIWLGDGVCFDENGVFTEVPDTLAAKAASECAEVVNKYREMYYEG